MAHPASDTDQTVEQGGAWVLPVLGGSILTLLWGACTLVVVVHIIMSPVPPH